MQSLSLQRGIDCRNRRRARWLAPAKGHPSREEQQLG